MAGRFVVAAFLCPLALAFSDTVPLLAWSSKQSNTLDRLPTNVRHVQPLLDQILNDDVCELDAVILVDQPGLHASDLRTLPPSSALAQILSSSPSQRQFQYLSDPASLSTLAETISTQCNSHLITLTPASSPAGYFTHDAKNVVSITLPSLQDQVGGTRKDRMDVHAARLADELTYLAASFPAYLVLYTSSIPAFDTNALFEDQHAPRYVFESRDANTTLPEGGILKRYQLLTPGLILVLLVSFFVLVPILLVGFNALAGIQSPLRVEPPKGYSAADKKAQ
ncbi:hypothetical protein Hypma_004190 [Hypsizygus marmoreus]|uniref:Protein BIG1 n=1 Tax=Hypsizygus marmoreus TaxID=39966 RepID=A0A369J092_HYPMA|nr:hypothetical protein Hypma_004190 [Hypsizygus marmoreus]